MRVLGLGDNTVDIYVDRGVQFPGGNAVNVAVQAKRLGAEAAYLGCIGTDAYGDLIRDGLVAEDVDISRLRRIDGPNPWCRIRHDGVDRVFDGSIPGVRGRYGFTAEDGAYIESFDVVHTSVSSDIDQHLPFVSRHTRRLSYDYSDRWGRADLKPTFAHLSIAFLSHAGGSLDDCRRLIDDTLALGVRDCVVVTRGEDGSCAGRRGDFRTETIRPADVVDTLGAGDAFIAAFLVAFAKTDDIAAALTRGAENAALACAHDGAFGRGQPITTSDARVGRRVAAT